MVWKDSACVPARSGAGTSAIASVMDRPASTARTTPALSASKSRNGAAPAGGDEMESDMAA
jgi:hypothetical protein